MTAPAFGKQIAKTIKKTCKTIASPAELFHFPYGNTD